MPSRIAASLSLIAFALCLIASGLQAGNTFATTVIRALVAMVGTYIIGLIIGLMGQKMLEENLRTEEQRLRNSSPPRANDR